MSKAPERIWVDDERSIGGRIAILEKEPPYMDDPYTTCYVPEALYDAQAQELAEARAENERLREALEKCADPHRHHAPCVHCCQTITECGSYIARAALAKGGE